MQVIIQTPQDGFLFVNILNISWSSSVSINICMYCRIHVTSKGISSSLATVTVSATKTITNVLYMQEIHVQLLGPALSSRLAVWNSSQRPSNRLPPKRFEGSEFHIRVEKMAMIANVMVSFEKGTRTPMAARVEGDLLGYPGTRSFGDSRTWERKSP